MGFKDWFKKKEVEVTNEKLVEVMSKYVSEARKLNWTDEEIREKFNEKGYSQHLIDIAFNLNKISKDIEEIKLLKGGKMVKKEVEQDEDEEEFDEEEEEIEEEEEEKPKKKVIEKKVAPKEEELTNPQRDAILSNHEERLRALESTLYRLKNI